MKTLRFLLLPAFLFAGGLLARAETVAPTAAPAWKLKDVNGKVVSSDQFKGKVMVVDFWATWCGPCRMEIPGYVELQKKYGKDLAVIGVSVDAQGPGVVKKFIDKYGVDYQIVMANDDVISAFGGAEGIQAIPTTFIIDREGKIRDRKVGAEHTADFEARLVQYLKQE
jgi:thiol-disulfide isomerase/thioredoxin